MALIKILLVLHLKHHNLGLRLMLNPPEIVYCMHCPSSACLLSLYKYYNLYGVCSYIKYCLHRQENITHLSLLPAVQIWKDRKIYIEMVLAKQLDACVCVYTGKRIWHFCRQWGFERIENFLLKCYCQATWSSCVYQLPAFKWCSHRQENLTYLSPLLADLMLMCVPDFKYYLHNWESIHFVALANSGNLKRWENFYWNCIAKQIDAYVSTSI